MLYLDFYTRLSRSVIISETALKILLGLKDSRIININNERE